LFKYAVFANFLLLLRRSFHGAFYYLRSIFSSRVILSQDWLPTVQLVLQADWQVLLHSPQAVVFFSAGFAIVLIITILLFLMDLWFYYNTLSIKLQADYKNFPYF